MGKKKKKRAAINDPVPDPRRIALASCIENEVGKRDREEEYQKQTMQPLKKVNSNPMVYEFIPMARNMFADSKSVDFGFDGSVDVPNQSVYMEEFPDDDQNFDRNLPDNFPSYTSFGDPFSPEIEEYEFEKLDNMETYDRWHFLKSRIGKDKFKELQESPHYETVLTMEDYSQESNSDDSYTVEDRTEDGWFGLPSLFIASLWSRPKVEEVDDNSDINQGTSQDLSIASTSQDPPDHQSVQENEKLEVISENTVTKHDNRQNSTSIKRSTSRGAKGQWLNHRGRMWQKAKTTKNDEISLTAKQRWLLHRSRMWHKSERTNKIISKNNSSHKIDSASYKVSTTSVSLTKSKRHGQKIKDQKRQNLPHGVKLTRKESEIKNSNSHSSSNKKHRRSHHCVQKDRTSQLSIGKETSSKKKCVFQNIIDTTCETANKDNVSKRVMKRKWWSIRGVMLFNSRNEEAHLVCPDVKEEDNKEEKKDAVRKCNCILLFLLFIGIIVLALASVFVAAYLGVNIPFLTDMIFPQSPDKMEESAISVDNNSTYSSEDTTLTSSPTNLYETSSASSTSVHPAPVKPPNDPALSNMFELGIVWGDLIKLNGETVNFISSENSQQSSTELLHELGSVVLEVFTYLGFRASFTLMIDASEDGSDVLRGEVMVYGRPDLNIGIMKWYGYTKNTAFSKDSAFTRRMTKLIPKLLEDREATVLGRFYYTVGNSFMRPAYKYLDTILVQRPPQHIPVEWGNCDGFSTCELELSFS